MTTQSNNTLEGILKKFAIDTHEVRPGQDETLNFDNAKAALTKWRDDAIADYITANYTPNSEVADKVNTAVVTRELELDHQWSKELERKLKEVK